MNIKAINAQCILSVSGGRRHKCKQKHLNNIVELIESVSADLDDYREKERISKKTANGIVSVVMDTIATLAVPLTGKGKCTMADVCKGLNDPAVRDGLKALCDKV